MIFKGKPTKIIMSQYAKETLDKLQQTVNEEIAKGTTKSSNQILLNAIKQKIEFLKTDPEYGIHIPRDRIPKKYKIDFEANNLWKINLSGAWRMIYTIRGNEIEIISLILDIVDHKDYEKKFGYRDK